MKNLLLAILLALAIPARSQEQSVPSKSPAAKKYWRYINPQDPGDHRRIRVADTNSDYVSTYYRRKLHGNIVGTSIGAALLTGGIVMISDSPKGQTSLGTITAIWGILYTAICGGSLVSNAVSLHHHRYSVVLHPNGLGLAYNF